MTGDSASSISAPGPSGAPEMRPGGGGPGGGIIAECAPFFKICDALLGKGSAPLPAEVIDYPIGHVTEFPPVSARLLHAPNLHEEAENVRSQEG